MLQEMFAKLNLNNQNLPSWLNCFSTLLIMLKAIAMDLFSGEVRWRDTGEWQAGGNVFAIFCTFLLYSYVRK